MIEFCKILGGIANEVTRTNARINRCNGMDEWESAKEQLIGEKPTLIHSWLVSCHLCKEAMSQVNQFRDSYKDKLNIIAVRMCAGVKNDIK
jgi:thiol-disulfide isomerase/thioredoxin